MTYDRIAAMNAARDRKPASGGKLYRYATRRGPTPAKGTWEPRAGNARAATRLRNSSSTCSDNNGRDFEMAREYIKGDWMTDGVIDNLNRTRRLEIEIINGKAYAIDHTGQPDTRDGPIELTVDDQLMAWGASTSFCPDTGELKRIGRQHFRSGRE